MLGVVSAFLFVPSIVLLSRQNSYYLSLIFVPFVAFVLYNFVSAFYYRLKSHINSDNLEKLSGEKAFGRMVHPTCTTLAILSWGAFIYFPNLKIFMANVWISVVVFSWIKMEKNAYSERPSRSINDTSGP
jgi:fatty acid desaturase